MCPECEGGFPPDTMHLVYLESGPALLCNDCYSDGVKNEWIEPGFQAHSPEPGRDEILWNKGGDNLDPEFIREFARAREMMEQLASEEGDLYLATVGLGKAISEAFEIPEASITDFMRSLVTDAGESMFCYLCDWRSGRNDV
jgi:hypothetical protein